MSQPGPAATTGHPTLPAMPGRILGIDAGGSGTRVILLQNGTVTARPDGPPMNALLTDGFAGHLRQIIEAADATAGGIGLPGVRQQDQARELSATLTRQTGCPVYVTGDADSARAGAFLGAPGPWAALPEPAGRRLGPLPVAGAGRVFGAPVIWDRFAELTGAVRPLAAATVGAALLAGQNAGRHAGQRASGA